MQTDIRRRDRKQQAVRAVHHTAMTRNQIAEILCTDHTFQQRFGQITDLPQSRSNQRCQNADPDRDFGEEAQYPDKKADDKNVDEKKEDKK